MLVAERIAAVTIPNAVEPGSIAVDRIAVGRTAAGSSRIRYFHSRTVGPSGYQSHDR